MVVAIAPSLQRAKQADFKLSEDELQVDLHLSLTLGITAKQAKRKLSRFLLDEVSLFIGPDEPMLVVAGSAAAFWRFPLQLSMAKCGRLGQVGIIDVNAYSGELLVTDEQLMEIKLNARVLTRSTALSADA